MEQGKEINVNIGFGTIVKTVFFLILLYILWQLLDLVLVILTAVVLASAIEPAAKWFVKYKVPRVLAVLIIYLLIFSIFVLIAIFFIPAFLNELKSLSDTLPDYIEKISLSDSVSSLSGFSGVLPENIKNSISIGDSIAQISEQLNQISGNVFNLINVIFGGLLSFILIIVMSFYLAVQEKGIENFLSTITPVRHEKYIIDLWHRSQRKIGLWMRGQLILALLVGIFVYLSLLVFGIKYAFLLAVLAAVFEIIPIFGPILAAIPAIIIALISGGISQALLVVAIYVIIQQFENQLLYPLVVRQVVGVPPIIAIIAIIAGGTLAGLLGVILSIPLAAVLMELFNDLDKEKHSLKQSEKPAS